MKKETFDEKLTMHAKAGFGGIWIKTDEAAEAMRSILKIASTNDWDVFHWDAGMAQTLDQFLDGINLSPNNNSRLLIIVHNPEKFMENFPEVSQRVANVISQCKQCKANLVAIGASFDVPLMLQRAFVVLDHDLPDKAELRSVLDQMQIDVEDAEKVVDAASGLTRCEAEDAFALSFVKSGSVKAEDVWRVKARELSKNGALELYDGDASFGELCGLEAVKEFCEASAGKRDAKGILMLGVPGAGKSQFAKALGNRVGLPTISIDFGAMMGSLVGQTEERLRRSLQAVERMAPAILFADEIEKALSGAGSSNDSGVSQRMLGTLLTWLNDRDSGIYFIGTCNDIGQLSSVSAGAFTRAERFDGIFYIGLPTSEQRGAMWEMYANKYEIELHGLENVNDEGWTGAEVKSCCRLARLLGKSIPETSRMVVPVCKTAEAAIDKLEQWSHERALDANFGGIYVSPRFASTAPRASSKRRAMS